MTGMEALNAGMTTRLMRRKQSFKKSTEMQKRRWEDPGDGTKMRRTKKVTEADHRERSRWKMWDVRSHEVDGEK